MRQLALALALFVPTLPLLAQCPGTDDGFEPNDSCANAQAITLGTHTGLYVEMLDADFYSLTIPANSLVVVECESSVQSDLFLQLMAPDCVQAVSTQGAGDFLRIEYYYLGSSPITATTHVAVRPTSPVSCTEYDLTLEVHPLTDCTVDDGFEPNNSCSEAPLVGPGNYSGLLTKDADFFAVDVPPGQQLRVRLGFQDLLGDLKLHMMDSQCNGLVRFSDSAVDGELVEWSNRTDVNALVYFIVTPFGSGTNCNEYSMAIDLVPDPCVAFYDDPFEDNNHSLNAHPGGLGELLDIGAANWDRDYYRYHLGEGVTLSAVATYDPSFFLDFVLEDAYGEPLTSTFDGTGMSSLAYTNTTGSLQEVRLKASPWHSSAVEICGSYNLQVFTSVGEGTVGSTQNSSGRSASMAGSGSTALADDRLVLGASGMATNQYGMFLASKSIAFVDLPGSDGWLFLGGEIHRLQHQLLPTGPLGAFHFEVDLGDIPGYGPVQPGDTWHFQAWFRDQNPHPTSNLTDRFDVTFQ